MSDTTAASPWHDLDAYIATPRLTGLTLSPDGASLVVSVQGPDADVTGYTTALWRVDPAGEHAAARLTRGVKGEALAAFLRDGSLLFTGKRELPATQGDKPGETTAALWCLPAGGGEPTQLTFYPAMGPLPERWGFDNQVYGWTPDGKSVLFRSWRDSRNISDPRVFTVAVTGGLPSVLPMWRAFLVRSQGSPSRPICWHSMRPSRLREPARPGVVSRWWPTRSGTYPPARASSASRSPW